MNRTVAIAIPCFNEEQTIARVVSDFREQLPDAAIYVFDNGSTDRSRAEAVRAGATVYLVPERGKGNVVRRMFAFVDADVVVMVDGDATYPASCVHALVEPVLAGCAEMTVGSRLARETRSDFRQLNRLGNVVFARLASLLLGLHLTDVLSGYRAFSRRFRDSVRLRSRGFEIEMELTIAAARLGLNILEFPVDLTSRPPGSHSKLRVLSDGFRILRCVASSAVRL